MSNSPVHKLAKFCRNRVYFSYAIGDTGRPVNVQASGVVLLGCALALIALAFLAYRSSPLPADVLKSAMQSKQDEITQLTKKLAALEQDRNFKESKIQAFGQELGVLHARLDRFEAISERLYKDKYFGQYLQDLDSARPIGSGDVSVETPPLTVFAIATQLALLQRRSDNMEQVMETSLDLLSRTQLNRSLQPHHWPVVNYRTYVSSHYGWRTDPFTGRRAWHSGLDIAGGFNAPIVASADGVVTYSGYRFGYGMMVEITHANGLITRYGHMNKALAHNGQSVRAGEVIGLMGSTGRSTGPHLHFEVLVGDHKVDPYPFIKGGRENARMLARSNTEQYDVSQYQ